MEPAHHGPDSARKGRALSAAPPAPILVEAPPLPMQQMCGSAYTDNPFYRCHAVCGIHLRASLVNVPSWAVS